MKGGCYNPKNDPSTKTSSSLVMCSSRDTVNALRITLTAGDTTNLIIPWIVVRDAIDKANCLKLKKGTKPKKYEEPGYNFAEETHTEPYIIHPTTLLSEAILAVYMDSFFKCMQ